MIEPKIFTTNHLQNDIKNQSLRGGIVTLISQALSFLLQVGSMMILARILTPQDYGIMAMVFAVTGFASVFSSLGLSVATIQRPEINHDQVSTLFWINTGIGGAIMIIVAAISPAVAWFYKTSDVYLVMMTLSVIFLLNGLSVQHNALLNRQMRFISLAKIKISSMLISIIVAIAAAFHGFGYWALVLHNITSQVCNVFGVWFAIKWWPSLPKRNTGINSMIRFGSDLVGFNIINYFSRNLDNILIGRFYGSEALGYYSKAYQLLMMPILNFRDPLNRVALPALSRLCNDQKKYRNYYMKYVSILAFISMPFVAFMFVCSENIIELALGPQWKDASNLFAILSIAAFIQPVGSTRGLVLVSTGKSRKYLYWGIINAIFTSLAFFVGLPWGPNGVALAYTIVNYILLYPSLFYIFMDSPLNVNDFFKAIYKPLLSSLIMGAVCFFFLQYLQELENIYILLICSTLSVISYLLSMIIVANGVQDIREYFSYCMIIFQ